MFCAPTFRHPSLLPCGGLSAKARPHLARPLRVRASAVRDVAPERFNGIDSLAKTPPTVRSAPLHEAFAPGGDIDFIACPLWQDEPPTALANCLTRGQRDLLVKERGRLKFKGEAGQTLLLPMTHHDRLMYVMLVGLGDPSERQSAFAAGGQVAQAAANVAASHILLTPPAERLCALDTAMHLLRGAHLGSYEFDALKSQRSPLAAPRITVNNTLSAAVQPAVVYAESAALARDLVNAPANVLTPVSLAAVAAREADRHGLTCRILGPDAMAAAGMNLLLAVGQASINPPRLVHMTYQPPGATPHTPTLALVGKGITYDTGGLNLKPGSSMLGMKSDMGGAAAVLGAIIGASQLNAPSTIHAILALAENSIAANAYRPGDVYASASGKTVEIINTDAEGRLALADALHYAQQLCPTEIIDVATLTGACIAALGDKITGMFANDATLAEGLLDSAACTGEPMWRLPLSSTLRHELHSNIADLKNLGSGGGGAITAALFLQEFVGDTPWAHLDIAGPAMHNGAATGAATATLLHYASQKRN